MELSKLEVGDHIFREVKMAVDIVRICRLTKTQIILANNEKFYKKNGLAVGSKSSWNAPRIAILTDDLRDVVKLSRLTRIAKKNIQNIIMPKNIKDTQRLISAIEDFVKKRN